MPGTREREDFVKDYSPDKGWRRWDREEPTPEEYRRERRDRRRDDSPRRGRGRSQSPRRRGRSPSPENRRNRWDQQQERQPPPPRGGGKGAPSSYLEQRNEQRQTERYRKVWERSPSPPPSYYRERKKWQKMRQQEKKKGGSKDKSHEEPVRDEFGRVPREGDSEDEDYRRKSSSSSSRVKREDDSPMRKRKSSPPPSSERERDRKRRKQEESSDSDSSSEEESSSDEEEDVWVEKVPDIPERPVGPEPMTKMAAPNTKVDYGGGLMKGEAEAYAQYVQEGKRIPRRGEVGLTSNEIENYEDLGFVMSGSRHKRMNAVRLRKENQVYTAEEKRAMLQLAFEEKAKKENKILADMREIVSQKLQSVDIPVDKE